jgi:hypothetical protein
MPRFGPTTRTELIRGLRQLGFRGPYSGGKHQFMVKDPVCGFRIPTEATLGKISCEPFSESQGSLWPNGKIFEWSGSGLSGRADEGGLMIHDPLQELRDIRRHMEQVCEERGQTYAEYLSQVQRSIAIV